MKICFVVAGNINKFAGLEKHVVELANALSKDEQHHISLIAHADYKKYLNHTINYIELDLNKSRFNILTYAKLQSVFYKQRFDIVHAQANKASFIISKLIRFHRQTKFIATIHNQKKKISFFNHFHHIIGVSSQVLHNIKQHKTVIYNGISLQNEHIDAIHLKQFLNIKNDFPIVVSVGRLVHAKGFDILLKAIKNLNINLVIVGDGSLKLELQQLSITLQITHKIFFVGFRENAKSFIKGSDLVIIASRNEGFPYVFVESILLKKPIISTKVSDINLFLPPQSLANINNEEELKNAIKYFLNNQAECHTSYEKFFTLAANKFTLDNMVQETIKVYKTLLGEIN